MESGAKRATRLREKQDYKNCKYNLRYTNKEGHKHDKSYKGYGKERAARAAKTT
jgi:hypothetical protein